MGGPDRKAGDDRGGIRSGLPPKVLAGVGLTGIAVILAVGAGIIVFTRLNIIRIIDVPAYQAFTAGMGVAALVGAFVAFTGWSPGNVRKRRTCFAVQTVLGLALFLGIFTFYPMVYRANQGVLGSSCANHSHGVCSALHRYVDCYKRLPYMEGVTGWEMLARFAGTYSDWGLNCNHAAPGAHVGGWQAVNLPPHKWRELVEKWNRDGPCCIPLFWCGKPNPIWGRLDWAVYTDDEYFVTLGGDYGGDDLETAVARLNRYLVMMGEEPIPMNVPEDIDWSQYETKKQR